MDGLVTIALSWECDILTWRTDLVPALLNHVGVKHVALGSHSAGTIYLMNTLLYLRDILHPRKPYVAFFGRLQNPSQHKRSADLYRTMGASVKFWSERFGRR